MIYKNNNKYILLGITSRGGDTCTDKTSGQFTKVELYLDFIQKAKNNQYDNDGILRKGDFEDLPKGFSLLGTTISIDSTSKIIAKDIKHIYTYNYKKQVWNSSKITNGILPEDFYIPAKNGFWILK